MMRQQAHRAIQLLRPYHPHERMRQREPREGKREVAARQNFRGESIGTADQESEIPSLAHPAGQPLRQLPCAHLRAVLIERHHPLIRMQGGEELAALELDGLARTLTGAAVSRFDLEQRQLQARAQAAAVVGVGLADPAGRSRADRYEPRLQ